MECDAGTATTETIFALIFATTLCWARQSGSGKRYKRLVYFAEKTDPEQKRSHFFHQFDERLQRLCVLDEQHVLHREYAALVRCARFRAVDTDLAEDRPASGEKREAASVNNRAKGKTAKTEALANGAAFNKLSQCRMIDALKACYNAVQYEHTACFVCSLDEKRQSTPLYFDEVVRLLQIYAYIQPSCPVIEMLEEQNVFTYARIVMMSENDVMSLLGCLGLWIIPKEPRGHHRHQPVTDRMATQNGNQKAAATLSGASPKMPQGNDEKPTVTTAAHQQDEARSPPVIIACKRKVNDDNGHWPPKKLPSFSAEALSVRQICSTLKNQCVEYAAKHTST